MQLEQYAKAVLQHSDVNWECEVGMNDAHETAAIQICVNSIGSTAILTLDLLRLYFGSCFQFMRGSSQQTISRLIELSKGQTQFDVVLVDGGHTSSVGIALNDLRTLAVCNARPYVLLSSTR